MDRKTACIGCDLLIELPDKIPAKSKICCPRCDYTLTRGHSNAVDYTLAIVISSLFLLFISYGFEFLSFETRGQYREIILIEATKVLYVKGFYFLSVLVFLLTIAFPLIYLLLLVRVLIPLKFRFMFKKRQARKPVYIIRIISKLGPWLMVDVFLIGVLVALIKMWSMADLTFGISFWAYVIFVLLFSYILYTVDQQKLLKWVDNDD